MFLIYTFFSKITIEMYPPPFCNLIVDTSIGGEILSCIYELLTQMCRLILYCAVLYLGRTFWYLVYMLKKHLLRRSEKKTIYLTGPLMLTGNCNRNCNRISILVGVQWIGMTAYYKIQFISKLNTHLNTIGLVNLVFAFLNTYTT